MRLKELPPHFYVRPTDVACASGRQLAGACARPGCGKPPAHPVHLRPNGSDFGDAPMRANG